RQRELEGGLRRKREAARPKRGRRRIFSRRRRSDRGRRSKAGEWNRARPAGLVRSRAPSQTSRPCAQEFARACAFCLRCESCRNGREPRAGLCRRGRRWWPRSGEGVRGRDRAMCSWDGSSGKSDEEEFKRNGGQSVEKKKMSPRYDQERFSARLKDPFSLSIFFWS